LVINANLFIYRMRMRNQFDSPVPIIRRSRWFMGDFLQLRQKMIIKKSNP